MISLLKKVHLFNQLTDHELAQLAEIATEVTHKPGEIIVRQNTTGKEIYVVAEGAVDVYVDGLDNERVLVVLGTGQVFGEMALIGHGYRSASCRAGRDGCKAYVILFDDFNTLCENNKNIGYVVMRNIALDLAFKLRHRNLASM
ncbi:MAG: cyclic nucleotide-binding domain-containing protein [Anaerolineales bacterium]|nr:cyclic nucleotide-binding domain-containing protein [Anaerolineales bacterium]